MLPLFHVPKSHHIKVRLLRHILQRATFENLETSAAENTAGKAVAVDTAHVALSGVHWSLLASGLLVGTT